METLPTLNRSGEVWPWSNRRRWLLTALVLIAMGALLGQVDASNAQPAAPGATPAQEVAAVDKAFSEEAFGGPRLRLHGSSASTQDALQLESRLELQISGLLARATLLQTFRNPGQDWVEAEYLLPLPHEAAVTQMELRVGERIILGEIRERAEARRVYDAARRAGKRSALLEQQRPHLFTTRVANIPPGEEIAVAVHMVLPVRYEDGEFSLRFPTTVTAPYIPGFPHPPAQSPLASPTWLPLDGSGWATATQAVPDAPLLTAPQQRSAPGAPLENPLSLKVELRPGIPLAEVDARYHTLAIDRRDEGFELAFSEGTVEMDRDLVLSWRPQERHRPQAAVFQETFEGERYAMMMLLPPVADAPVPRQRRELVLVLDVSGSMQGAPIRQAKQAVAFALDTLQPEDYFNLVVFNDRHRVLFGQSRRADAAALDEARRFVESLNANRGTEMLPALSAALSLSVADGDLESTSPLRQLIFVTDGAVGNEQELMALLERHRGDARLFTVGIGSAPNSYFMHEAARRGRGSAVFIGQASEVSPQMRRLLADIQQPMVTNLNVDWPGSAEAYPAPIPDLYAGQPLIQLARLSGPLREGRIRVTGTFADRHWEQQLALPREGDDAGVAATWARRKLDGLLRELHRGIPTEEVRSRALPLALKFSLASPFTSFVAVEQEPRRPEGASVSGRKVPNTQPRGQAAQRFAFAQGATNAPLNLTLALACLGLAVLMLRLQRRDSWV